MSKIHNISSYSLHSDDLLFFDNNIWMFLFCPIGNYKKEKQKEYSSFFKLVCSLNICIWINSLVLSEFCNAWLRIEFENWKNKPENKGKKSYKKDFIPSDDYKETIDDIKPVVNKIIEITEKAPDSFNAINIDNVFSGLDNCDFNDSYYLNLADLNKWKIVTDDSDFFKTNNLNVEIITANTNR